MKHPKICVAWTQVDASAACIDPVLVKRLGLGSLASRMPELRNVSMANTLQAHLSRRDFGYLGGASL